MNIYSCPSYNHLFKIAVQFLRKKLALPEVVQNKSDKYPGLGLQEWNAMSK